MVKKKSSSDEITRIPYVTPLGNNLPPRVVRRKSSQSYDLKLTNQESSVSYSNDFSQSDNLIKKKRKARKILSRTNVLLYNKSLTCGENSPVLPCERSTDQLNPIVRAYMTQLTAEDKEDSDPLMSRYSSKKDSPLVIT